MARYQRQRKVYPIGSVSHATMRAEDLIPAFSSELEYQLSHGPSVGRETRKAHTTLLRDIRKSGLMDIDEWTDEQSVQADELVERLFDSLEAYAGPYFYFGSHPGDGSDYGFWLSEEFEDEFEGLKVSDTSEVPSKYRGEVLHVNDHGNMTLYVQTSRGRREVWSVV